MNRRDELFSDTWLVEEEWSRTAEHFGLSSRELQVLRLISSARDNVSAAESLGISRDGIKAHLKSIYSKMKCSNKVEVILVLVELNLHRSPRKR